MPGKKRIGQNVGVWGLLSIKGWPSPITKDLPYSRPARPQVAITLPGLPPSSVHLWPPLLWLSQPCPTDSPLVAPHLTFLRDARAPWNPVDNWGGQGFLF